MKQKSSLKRCGAVLLLLVLAAIPIELPAAMGAAMEALPAAHSFFTPMVVGERAEFCFEWLGFTVSKGEAYLKERLVHRGRDAWHVVVHFRTTRVLDLLFPVRDEYHSFIDVETLESLRFEKNISEGHYRADEVVEFDHEKRKGYYFSRLNKSEKVFDTASLVHDPISAVYWFRAFVPMAPGGGITVPVNYEERNWNVHVPMVDWETIEFPKESERMTVKIMPYITNLEEHIQDWTDEHKEMLRKSRITAWVDESDSRLPLRMSLKVPLIGSIKAYVTHVERPQQ